MVQIQKNNLINTPDASRLIYGLRDTGYNFPMAVADIIDNSIAANAKNISVDKLYRLKEKILFKINNKKAPIFR